MKDIATGPLTRLGGLKVVEETFGFNIRRISKWKNAIMLPMAATSMFGKC